MKIPSAIVRRAIIAPLWLPVGFGLAGVLQLLAWGSLLVDRLTSPFRRRRRQRVYRLAMFAQTYILLNLRMLITCWLFWLRRPGLIRDEDAWQREHAELLADTLDQLMTGAHEWLGYRVEPQSLTPTPRADRPLLVLARHAGPGDSFTLAHQLLIEYRRVPRVVLKEALRWDPALDVILTRLGAYFLPSVSGAGDDHVAAVARLADDLGPGDALLIFPEGGNWTPRRHRRSVKRLWRSGRFRAARRAEARQHVLPPRPAGTVAALAAAPEADVLVVTHTGLDTLVNAGQVWRALPLDGRPMRLRAWLHPAASVPRTSEAAMAWLDDQWAAVNDWIDEETS